MAEETYAPKSPDLSSFPVVSTQPSPPPQPLPAAALQHHHTEYQQQPHLQQQQHHHQLQNHQSHNHNQGQYNLSAKDDRRYSWAYSQQQKPQLQHSPTQASIHLQQPSPPHQRQQSLDIDYRYNAPHASNQVYSPVRPQLQQQTNIHQHLQSTPIKSEHPPQQPFISPHHPPSQFAQLAPHPQQQQLPQQPGLPFASPSKGQPQFIPPTYDFKPVPSAYPQGPTPILTGSNPSAMPPRKSAQPAPAPPPIDPSPVRTKFPTARIKRIMQADEEVGKVAQQTPIAVGKALELFMIHMVSKSADIARERNSRRVTAQMLKQVIENDGQYDFLADIVAKVGEEEKKGRAGSSAKAETSSDEEMEQPEPKKKPRGGGRKKKAAAPAS
ncbi:hypothetical protein F5X68DRAFT_273425 [Plectosphaerella plurivora]|uniref:NCT transcriptional regulatory complex subunit A n=1 Tax=Plectosphaerella plurivora TaxID=936078 RepID=A0A9P8VJS8_9PEZI|nr:hypothetical protein F5X68DRAFT_273425 [Plectosphaerella plurivora]